jgi:hypothetical protein
MPIDVSPGSLAAVAITTLFWWTVLSPAGLLAVAALCSRRPRLRAGLTIAVLAPPLVTLLPVAVLHGGTGAAAAAAAVLVTGGAIALAAVSVARERRDPQHAERFATASFLFGVAGGMIGSAALVGALLFA